jgi:hypothetical protein
MKKVLIVLLVIGVVFSSQGSGQDHKEQDTTDTVIEKALKFLKEEQDEGGYWDTALEARYQGIQIIVASMAGLVFVGTDNTQKKGKYSKVVQRCLKFIDRELQDGLPRSYQNWILAWVALFLSELQIKQPSAQIKKRLQKIAKLIARNQEKKGGGWSHDPWTRTYAPMTSLTALTNLMVAAIFNLKRAGIRIPGKVIRRVKGFYKKVIYKNGEVKYGDRDDRKVYKRLVRAFQRRGVRVGPRLIESGRAGGALFGMNLLGLQDHQLYKKAMGFYDDYFEDFATGHGSAGLTGYLFAALAYNTVLDEFARESFDELITEKILESQDEDSGEITWDTPLTSTECPYYSTAILSLILLIRDKRFAFSDPEGGVVK